MTEPNEAPAPKAESEEAPANAGIAAEALQAQAEPNEENQTGMPTETVENDPVSLLANTQAEGTLDTGEFYAPFPLPGIANGAPFNMTTREFVSQGVPGRKFRELATQVAAIRATYGTINADEVAKKIKENPKTAESAKLRLTGSPDIGASDVDHTQSFAPALAVATGTSGGNGGGRVKVSVTNPRSVSRLSDACARARPQEGGIHGLMENVETDPKRRALWWHQPIQIVGSFADNNGEINPNLIGDVSQLTGPLDIEGIIHFVGKTNGLTGDVTGLLGVVSGIIPGQNGEKVDVSNFGNPEEIRRLSAQALAWWKEGIELARAGKIEEEDGAKILIKKAQDELDRIAKDHPELFAHVRRCKLCLDDAVNRAHWIAEQTTPWDVIWSEQEHEWSDGTKTPVAIGLRAREPKAVNEWERKCLISRAIRQEVAALMEEWRSDLNHVPKRDEERAKHLQILKELRGIGKRNQTRLLEREISAWFRMEVIINEKSEKEEEIIEVYFPEPPVEKPKGHVDLEKVWGRLTVYRGGDPNEPVLLQAPHHEPHAERVARLTQVMVRKHGVDLNAAFKAAADRKYTEVYEKEMSSGDPTRCSRAQATAAAVAATIGQKCVIESTPTTFTMRWVPREYPILNGEIPASSLPSFAPADDPAELATARGTLLSVLAQKPPTLPEQPVVPAAYEPLPEGLVEEWAIDEMPPPPPVVEDAPCHESGDERPGFLSRLFKRKPPGDRW